MAVKSKRNLIFFRLVLRFSVFIVIIILKLFSILQVITTFKPCMHIQFDFSFASQSISISSHGSRILFYFFLKSLRFSAIHEKNKLLTGPNVLRKCLIFFLNFKPFKKFLVPFDKTQNYG